MAHRAAVGHDGFAAAIGLATWRRKAATRGDLSFAAEYLARTQSACVSCLSFRIVSYLER